MMSTRIRLNVEILHSASTSSSLNSASQTGILIGKLRPLEGMMQSQNQILSAAGQYIFTSRTLSLERH